MKLVLGIASKHKLVSIVAAEAVNYSKANNECFVKGFKIQTENAWCISLARLFKKSNSYFLLKEIECSLGEESFSTF